MVIVHIIHYIEHSSDIKAEVQKQSIRIKLDNLIRVLKNIELVPDHKNVRSKLPDNNKKDNLSRIVTKLLPNLIASTLYSYI